MMVQKSSYSPKHVGLIVMMGMTLGIIPDLVIRADAQSLPWFGERRTTSEQSSDTPPNTSGQSAGSRGCLFTDPTFNQNTGLQNLYPLSILNADDSIQYTTLEYPTFAWVMGLSTQHSVEFRLYQSNNEGENVELLYETNLLDAQSSAGVKLFSLPNFLDPLSLDGKYIWQVEVVCDPDRPSSNLFVEVELDRIEASASFQQSIQHSSNLVEKIELLNNENLWLDALDLAIQDYETEAQLQLRLEQLASALNSDALDLAIQDYETEAQLQLRLEQLASALNSDNLYALVRAFDSPTYITVPDTE